MFVNFTPQKSGPNRFLLPTPKQTVRTNAFFPFTHSILRTLPRRVKMSLTPATSLCLRNQHCFPHHQDGCHKMCFAQLEALSCTKRKTVLSAHQAISICTKIDLGETPRTSQHWPMRADCAKRSSLFRPRPELNPRRVGGNPKLQEKPVKLCTGSSYRHAY